MRIPDHLAVTDDAKLVRRPDSPNWYLELHDRTKGRMRLFSTGAPDQAVAEAARARLAAGAEAPDAQDAAAQAVAVAAVAAGAGPDRVKIAAALDLLRGGQENVISSPTQMKIAIRHLKAFYGEREVGDLQDESLQQAYVDFRFDGSGAPKQTDDEKRAKKPSGRRDVAEAQEEADRRPHDRPRDLRPAHVGYRGLSRPRRYSHGGADLRPSPSRLPRTSRRGRWPRPSRASAPPRRRRCASWPARRR